MRKKLRFKSPHKNGLDWSFQIKETQMSRSWVEFIISMLFMFSSNHILVLVHCEWKSSLLLLKGCFKRLLGQLVASYENFKKYTSLIGSFKYFLNERETKMRE